MARYLDICFGFLAFFSAAALMYGAFVESKTWMSAWILGSIIVLLGRWLWYLKGKFSQVLIMCCVVSLFRNQRFMLDEMTLENASKFVRFLKYENPCSFFPHFVLLYFFP